jgi:hypothetical protein
MKSLNKKLTWLTLFSIAMGFMETAVVIYLRKIYYPRGFSFPLIPIDSGIALVEFYREIATIIMLVGIGIISGKNTSQKFAFFLYCFAIWDLFYYIFLKIFIDWPQSLFTWDILFLIPVPWVGPVLAPCIVSVTMIIFMLFIIYLQEKGFDTKIKVREWILLSFGSAIIIISFIWDYIKYVSSGNAANTIWTLSSKKSLFFEIATYVPTFYNWSLFSIGELIIIIAILIFINRIKNGKNGI